MSGEQISVGGKTYILGNFLASGLIGTVFPAWEPSDIEKTPVKAVKVPAPNLTEDLAKKFWQEFYTLEKLNAQWNQLHPSERSPFPSIEKGKKDDGAEIFVMEYIPDEMILSRVFDQAKPFERETQYLQAALRYVEMLDALHQAGYTCPDRKTPDVRWRDDRLVVLDWNVVAGVSPQNTQQDFHLFGSMWHQFLTGKYAPTGLDILDDTHWGSVSIGARLIIENLIMGRYSNTGQVKTDLAEFLASRQQQASALAGQAQQIFENIKNLEKQIGQYLENKSGATMPDETLNDKDLEALKRIDLAWQISGDVYHSQRDELAKFVRGRSGRFTYYAQLSLARGNYSDGLAFMDRLDQWVRAEDPALRLSLARWRTLIQAATWSASFREVGQAFSTWLSKLDPLPAEDKAAAFWSEREADFPSTDISSTSELEIFSKELKLHKAWADVHEMVGAEGYTRDQYSRAQQSLNTVNNLLAEIEKKNQEYAQALKEAVLADLEGYAQKIEKRVQAEAGFSIADGLSLLAQQNLVEYIRYRIEDARKLDEDKQTLRLILNDVKELELFVHNLQSYQVVEIVCKLLTLPEILRGFRNDFTSTLLSLLSQLNFPSDGWDGVLVRSNAAAYLQQYIEKIPVELRAGVKKIQLQYISDAFSAAENLVNWGDFDQVAYNTLPSRNWSDEIEEIRKRIETRLNAQQKIDKALDAQDWNKAYAIAHEAGINIYDPFATFREAKQAVKHAAESLDKVKTTNDQLQLRIDDLQKKENQKKAWEEIWGNLSEWNAALVDLQPEIWTDDSAPYFKNFSMIAQKAHKLGITLDSAQKDWFEQLQQETETLRKVSLSESELLQRIKNTLNQGQAVIGKDFVDFCDIHERVRDSHILNRLYAKAEERYLNQPDTSDVGHQYRQAIEEIEKGFKKSDLAAFNQKIIAFETSLANEKNHILRKVYQADLFPWKQRLSAWERASELLKYIRAFEEKVSLGDPKSRANAWSDEKNVALFCATLLDLRDLPPETFVLQANDLSATFGQTLERLFGNIEASLDITNTAFASKKWGQPASGIEHLLLDDTVKKEWSDYFTRMTAWLKRQMATGQVFIDELALASAPQVSSDSGTRSLTPQA